MAEKDILKDLRQKRTTSFDIDEKEAEKIFAALDEEESTVERPGQAADSSQVKTLLGEMKRRSAESQQDIHDLMAVLRLKFEEIGAIKDRSKEYEGAAEKWYAFWGNLGIQSAREQADRLRRQRQQIQTVTEDLKELAALNAATIGEVVKREEKNAKAYVAFTRKYKELLGLLKVRVPEHEKVKAEITLFQGEIDLLRTEMESLEAEARVAKEAELEAKELKLQQKQIRAAELLEKIKTWNQFIPILQEAREATQKSIQSFRQMRTELAELMRGFMPLFEMVMVPIQDLGVTERFDNIVPVIKEAVDNVLSLFVDSATAAMDRAAAHSAIPLLTADEQLKKALQLKQSVDKYYEVMNKIADEQRKGPQYPKFPSGSGGGEAPAGDSESEDPFSSEPDR